MNIPTLRIVAISGSLRDESYTTKIIQDFQKRAPKQVQLELVAIADLPLLKGEKDGEHPPKAVQTFVNALRSADAFLLATPEYNRSYTPALKNALDWASLDAGLVWHNKPAAIIGVSPYSLGAFGAVHHLRQVLTYLNMHPMQQPEFYITFVADKYKDGVLTDAHTIKKISEFWPVFVEWIGKVNAQN